MLVLGNEGDGEGRGGLKEGYRHVNMGGWFETEIRSFGGVCVFCVSLLLVGLMWTISIKRVQGYCLGHVWGTGTICGT